jgi:prevent-host-death family protein
MHEAKSNLSRLVEEVEAGGEIILARAGKPVARPATIADDLPRVYAPSTPAVLSKGRRRRDSGRRLTPSRPELRRLELRRVAG